MRSSKVFKKKNGDRYEVRLSLSTDSCSNKFYWDMIVLHCPKGKRTFKTLNCQDDWEYRKLDLEEGEKYYKRFILSHIPAEWINEVQLLILAELNKLII